MNERIIKLSNCVMCPYHTLHDDRDSYCHLSIKVITEHDKEGSGYPIPDWCKLHKAQITIECFADCAWNNKSTCGVVSVCPKRKTK